MRSNPEQTLARAEAAFKRKELQAIEGQKAMAEYRAKAAAIRENTARLRALRLAREEAAPRQVAAAMRKPDAPARRKTA